MNFSEEVKPNLWAMIDEMSMELSDYVYNPGHDFARKKKWDFSTMMKFMISMESQSLKNELHKLWGYTADCPSNASFNQRRGQIRPEAFKSLFDSFTTFYMQKPKLFKGYRLIACDGSDINISRDSTDTSTFFPIVEDKGFNQLHLNAMYDLLSKVYTDAIIQPGRKENEEAMNPITRLLMLLKTTLIF